VLRPQAVGHATGRKLVAVGPGAAIGVLLRHPLGAREGDPAVEEHVGCKRLRNRGRAALKRKHRDYERKQRRDERRAINPWLNQGRQRTLGAPIAFLREKRWQLHRHASS
jgi:hypothetical protein